MIIFRALILGDVKEVLIQIIDKGADVNAKPKGIRISSDETPLSINRDGALRGGPNSPSCRSRC